MPAKRSINLKRRSARQPLPAPSYKRFRSTSLKASRVKSRNRSKGTRPERELLRALRRLGAHHATQGFGLPGNPDIVFARARLVVFCDGDFWHGRDWEARRRRLRVGANAAYWIPKIEYNIARDQHINRQLRGRGWSVVRLWETDILRDASVLAAGVMAHVVTRLKRG